jgi:hypothetical protein
MLKNGARGEVRTHVLIEEGQETLGEAVEPVKHHAKMF